MAGAIVSTGRKDYCTPQYILDPVRAFFRKLNGRGITLDPCSNPKSQVLATRNIMLETELELAQQNAMAFIRERVLHTMSVQLCDAEVYGDNVTLNLGFETGDGLAASWQGENVYDNPPFGYDKVAKIGIKNWIRKALAEAELAQIKRLNDIDPRTEIISCVPDTPETIPWKNGILLKAQGRCQLSRRVPFVGMKAVIPKPISLVYFGSNPKLFKEMFKSIGRVENPSEVYADQAEISL